MSDEVKPKETECHRCHKIVLESHLFGASFNKYKNSMTIGLVCKECAHELGAIPEVFKTVPIICDGDDWHIIQ